MPIIYIGELLKRLKRYAWKVYRWVKPCVGSNPIFSLLRLLKKSLLLKERFFCLMIPARFELAIQT